MSESVRKREREKDKTSERKDKSKEPRTRENLRSWAALVVAGSFPNGVYRPESGKK